MPLSVSLLQVSATVQPLNGSSRAKAQPAAARSLPRDGAAGAAGAAPQREEPDYEVAALLQAQQRASSSSLAFTSLASSVASVAALVAPKAAAEDTSAPKGDMAQGVIFTMICLLIVVGVYLLAFNEYRPGEDAYPMPFDNAQTKVPGSMAQIQSRPPTQRGLGSQSHLWQTTPTGPAQFTQRPSIGGMPGTPAPTLPGTSDTLRMGALASRGADDEELPKIYPPLVMQANHSRLAVPLLSLASPQFELDVLSPLGVPLLAAKRTARSVEIALHSVSTLLSVVTSELDIFDADGRHFGALRKEGPTSLEEPLRMVLRSQGGKPILAVSANRRDDDRGYNFKLSSLTGGHAMECATAERRAAMGQLLPGEHYLLDAQPGVDAVLVLTVLLGALVFGMPLAGLGLPSARPSSTPFSLAG